MTDRKPSKADERAARLAEQLRANLRKRKVQAQGSDHDAGRVVIDVDTKPQP